MNIWPKWTPEFLETCEKVDKLFGWYNKAALQEVNRYLANAETSELKEALENRYIDFDLFEGDTTSLGPYRIRTYSITINDEDMLDWDEYLSKVLTLRRLEGNDEERA